MNEPSRKNKLKIFVFFAITALLISPAWADEPPEQQTSPLEVICLAEHFVVYEGERVALNAWAQARADKEITYEWTDSKGKPIAHGATVTWDVSAEKLGENEPKRSLRAGVSVARGDERQRCEVEVILAQRGPNDVVRDIRGTAGALEAQRRLLVGTDQEASAGLYSYLLFAGRPSKEIEEQRYLNALRAVFDLFHDGGLVNNERPFRLNMTHVPVEHELEGEKGWDALRWAREALMAYNYGRASQLLAAADLDERGGPYLVATLEPLRENPRIRTVVNLGGKTPEQVTFWVKHFKWVAAKERSWGKEAVARVTLEFRNLISMVGSVAPKSLDQSIKLVIISQ